MLIVSKFHDYYDTASAYGIDKEWVYKREKKDTYINVQKGSRFWTRSDLDFYIDEIKTRKYKYVIKKRLIGFCGQLRPLLIIIKSPHDLCVVGKEYYFYNEIQYIMYLAEENILKKKEKYYWHKSIRSVDGAEEFFDSKTYYKYFEKYFVEYKVPIFVLKRSDKRGFDFQITSNCNLEDLGFAKVKDPVTAFQEIYMYLAGVLGNTKKDTVDISDKDKLQQRGFDKYSFKTMKGDKKPRAKNRGKR